MMQAVAEDATGDGKHGEEDARYFNTVQCT